MSHNTPNIRFRDFHGEWEEKTLRDNASFSKGRGYSKADIKEQGVPLLLYGSLYTDYKISITEVSTFADEKDGSVKSTGKEVVVPASGETAEDIARASAIREKGIILGGDLNIITPNDTIDPTFLALEMTYGDSHNKLVKTAQGASVVHLHNSNIDKLSILIPSLPEQRTIGEFFSGLDRLIGAEGERLVKLRQVKAACLQNMFPQPGHNTPQLRFNGFQGEWERVKLGEILQTLSFKQYLKEPEHNGQYEVIQQGNNPIVGYANGNPCLDFDDTVVFGDHTLSIYKPRAPFFVATDGVRILKGKNNTNGCFLYAMLSKYKPQGEGYKRYYSILADTYGFITYDIAEQRKIGDYFSALDRRIELQSERVSKLRQVKSACLDGMFV